MSTLSVSWASQITVVETFTGNYIASADNTATTNGLNETGTLTASTSVPVIKHVAYQKTMSGGAATIDLTSQPGINTAETIDMTGLKVQLAKFRNLATNANNITVAKGASNGHTLLGASWEFTLAPGQSVTIYGNEAVADVAAGVKTIDITGTGSQVLEIQMVAG